MATFPGEVDSPVLKYKNRDGVLKEIKLFETKTAPDSSYLEYTIQPDPASSVKKTLYIPIVANTHPLASEIKVMTRDGVLEAMRLPGYIVGTQHTIFTSADWPLVQESASFTVDNKVRNASSADSYNFHMTITCVPWATKGRIELYEGGILKPIAVLKVASPWSWSPGQTLHYYAALDKAYYRVRYYDQDALSGGTHASAEIWT